MGNTSRLMEENSDVINTIFLQDGKTIEVMQPVFSK